MSVALSLFFWALTSLTSDGQTFFILVFRSDHGRQLRAQNVESFLLELLFTERATGIFASYLMELDMAMISLSCHFALDILSCKEGMCGSAGCFIGHFVHGVSLRCGTIAILATS